MPQVLDPTQVALPPESGPPPGMAPGLGTIGGGPVQAPTIPEDIANLALAMPEHSAPVQPVSVPQPANPTVPQVALPESGPPPGMAPGLGTIGGGPLQVQTPVWEPSSYIMPSPAAASLDNKPVQTFTPLEAADPSNEGDRNLLSSVNSYLAKGGDIGVFSQDEMEHIRSITKGLNVPLEQDPAVIGDPKAFKELVYDKHKYAPRLLDELGNPLQDPLNTMYNTGKMALNIGGGLVKNIFDMAIGVGQDLWGELSDIQEGKFPGMGSSVYKENEMLSEGWQRNKDLWLSLMPHGAYDIFLDAKARVEKSMAANPQDAEAADMAQSELIRNGLIREQQAQQNVAQVKAQNVQSLIEKGLTGPALVVQQFQATPQQEAVAQMLTDPTILLTEGAGKLTAMSLVSKAGVATGRLEEATAALSKAHANVLDIANTKSSYQFLLDKAATDADRISASRALSSLSKVESEASDRFTLAQKELSAAQDSVNKDMADSAQPSRLRKVTGDALVDLGNVMQKPAAITDWVKSVPSKFVEMVMPNASESVKQVWSELAGRSLVGGVTHVLGGGPIGALVNSLGGPEVMRAFGRDVAMIGEQLGVGMQTLPFWKAIKENSGGMTHAFASLLDHPLVYAIPDTARGAVMGGLVGGAMGTAATGGTTQGFEQGASGGLLFGAAGAGLGQLKKFNSPGELHAASIGDRARFIRSLHPTQGAMFSRLDPNVQLALSVYARTHPDLDVTFFSDPSRANGSHQVIAGRGVVNINVLADNPLKVVFQHEVGHHVAAHGLTGQVDTYMIGDATSGQPGIFTKRNPDGSPMIEKDRYGRDQYVPDENFEAYKAQYNARLPKDHPPENDHGIAQEMFADLHAEALSDPHNVQKLVRGGHIPDALVNDNAVTNWLARVGVGIDGETGRALITDTVAKTKGLNDMITEFYRQRSYKTKPPENDIGDTRIPVSSAQKGTPEFEFLQKTFDASGDLKRNPDHTIAVDSTGRPQILPQKTVDAIHGRLADHIVSWLRNNPNHSEIDNPNVVRPVTDRDGRQFLRGQVLPKELFDDLIGTNQFNPNQVLNWQKLNGIMTRNDGTIVLGVYNTAGKQGRYSSLPARERAVVPIYHEISPKTRQVNIKSYDPEQMMFNLEKYMKRKVARDIWDGNLTNAHEDVKAYLDNLANGRPSETGIGMDKKAAINQLFGLGNDVIPTLDALSRKNTSVLKNFRLDRLNRLQEMPGYQQPFHGETYEQVRGYLQPRRGESAAPAQEAATTEATPAVEEQDPTAIPVTYRQTRTGKTVEEKIPYDITKSPLYRDKQPGTELGTENDYAHKDFMTAPDQKRLTQLNKNSAVTAGADKLVDEFNNQWKDDPRIMGAKGWYDHVRKYLGKAFGGDNRLFAELLAATSAGQGVIQNWKDALEAYRMYRKGAYDDAIKEFKRTGDISKDMQPRKENGALYGFNSNAILRVLANTWFSTVEGPKTPNFFQNLFRQGKQATIDLWAARTMRRLGHDGVEGASDRWRLQPGSEMGVSNLDFGFSQEVFKQAAERLGIDPHQLQAIAWYGEKLHWANQGWSKGGAQAAMESYIPQLKAYSEAPTMTPQAKGKDSRRQGIPP